MGMRNNRIVTSNVWKGISRSNYAKYSSLRGIN